MSKYCEHCHHILPHHPYHKRNCDDMQLKADDIDALIKNGTPVTVTHYIDARVKELPLGVDLDIAQVSFWLMLPLDVGTGEPVQVRIESISALRERYTKKRTVTDVFILGDREPFVAHETLDALTTRIDNIKNNHGRGWDKK